MVPSSAAWLELRGDINPAACTDGLAEYSHVQIIFIFHENTNAVKTRIGASHFKAKVSPPRLYGCGQLHGAGKVGALATRSPHRPNPIGLSTAKIERVDMKIGRVYLSAVDLLDGTPVIDIKPYIPAYDCVAHAIVPKWVAGDKTAMGGVEWSAAAEADLAATVRIPGSLVTLDDAQHATRVVQEVLACDIRSGAKQRRESVSQSMAKHKLVLDRLEFMFQIGLADRCVQILSVRRLSQGKLVSKIDAAASTSEAWKEYGGVVKEPALDVATTSKTSIIADKRQCLNSSNSLTGAAEEFAKRRCGKTTMHVLGAPLHQLAALLYH